MTAAPYISWLGHGAADLAPPGVFTDAKAHMFAIDADQAAMQVLVDQLLNPAAGGVVSYKAALPVAMLSFIDIAQCTSGTDVVGWLPGRECAIWVPLIEEHPGDPLRTRLVMWAPYIFISYTIGMVTGREIWGWPKVLADIAVSADDPANPQFSCTTTYFPTLAATTQGLNGTLFRIVPQGAGEGSPTIWQSGAEALEGLLGGFLGGLAGVLINALRLRPQAPSVALKQFRQAGAAQTACYQAIVDSPIEITAFSGGGPIFDAFSLEITTCESHQIVRDLLGRAPDPVSTTVPVKFAAWVTMDFQALSGADIVVAGQAAEGG